MLLTLTFNELCLAIFGRDKAIQQNDTPVRGRSRDVEAVIFRPLPLPHLSLRLPLTPTKNEKTTVDNFSNFCGSVACLLLHFITLRGQKLLFIAITLPTSFELIVPNYSVFLLFRY